jgi:hypothetical protein
MVIVSGPKMVDFIRKAPDDELSNMDDIEEVVYGDIRFEIQLIFFSRNFMWGTALESMFMETHITSVSSRSLLHEIWQHDSTIWRMRLRQRFLS